MEGFTCSIEKGHFPPYLWFNHQFLKPTDSTNLDSGHKKPTMGFFGLDEHFSSLLFIHVYLIYLSLC